jgi:hypothetical protein
MLILTRRVGESIMIGNDVVVAVLGVKGKEVRICDRPLFSPPVASIASTRLSVRTSDEAGSLPSLIPTCRAPRLPPPASTNAVRG